MIRVELDRNSRREFLATVDAFKEKKGGDVEECVIELARANGRQLAQKCPPFGLSASVGKKFQASIAKQVNRAVSAANVAGVEGSAAQVHEGFRDRRGQVPKGLRDRGKYQRDPVSVREKEVLIDRQQERAGAAKGSWIAATEELGKKLSNIAAWIRRHTSHGHAIVKRQGISTEVSLTNERDWIQRLQTPSMIRSAAQAAFRNTIKRMQRILDR